MVCAGSRAGGLRAVPATTNFKPLSHPAGATFRSAVFYLAAAMAAAPDATAAPQPRAAPDERAAVLSEVHMESCPPHARSWCTRFSYGTATPLPPSAEAVEAAAESDSDGDTLLQRRPARRDKYVLVHHSLATPVSRCGEQVWLGACLLADWLLWQVRERVHCAQQLPSRAVQQGHAAKHLTHAAAAAAACTRPAGLGIGRCRRG